MRHWTIAQFAARYDELQTATAAERGRQPETNAGKIEKFRTVAALNLMLADLYKAAFKSAATGTTIFELTAYVHAVEEHQRAAGAWRGFADQLASRAGA